MGPFGPLTSGMGAKTASAWDKFLLFTWWLLGSGGGGTQLMDERYGGG